MRPGIRFATGLALAALVSLPALAQDRGHIEVAARPVASSDGVDRDRLADFLHCLKVLDLTEAQKAAIQQFLEAEKPTLAALHDTLKTDRQTLEADAGASPPDPCKVGADFLKVVSDRQAIRAEFAKIKEFIESQLTAEQKARFEGCLLGSDSKTAAGTN